MGRARGGRHAHRAGRRRGVEPCTARHGRGHRGGARRAARRLQRRSRGRVPRAARLGRLAQRGRSRGAAARGAARPPRTRGAHRDQSRPPREHDPADARRGRHRDRLPDVPAHRSDGVRRAGRRAARAGGAWRDHARLRDGGPPDDHVGRALRLEPRPLPHDHADLRSRGAGRSARGGDAARAALARRPGPRLEGRRHDRRRSSRRCAAPPSA